MAPKSGIEDRVLLGLAFVLAASWFGLHTLIEVTRHAFSAWASFRLGFSAQLAAGLDLYPALGKGPVIGDIYGPVAAAFYLPPLLAPNATDSVLWAQAYTVLSVGGLLMVWCVHKARAAELGALVGASAAAVGIGVMLAVPGLCHCLVQVHADAPSLLFGALSCLVWSGATRYERGRSLASAVLWSLAVLSKQSASFVLLGQLVLLWRWFGLRAAAMHALCAALGVVAMLYGAAWAVGSEPRAMWFYLVTVPGKHSLLFSDDDRVLSRVVALLVPLVALLSASWVMLLRRGFRAALESPACRDTVMLLGVTLATIPISLLAGLKDGGYLNNYHAHYYALFATCLASLDAMRSASEPSQLRSHLRLLAAVTLASTLLVPSDLGNQLPRLRDQLRRLDRSPHALASAYLRERDDAYFPWYPLSVAQEKRRAYHSFDGLRTLDIAGLGIDQDAFTAFAPTNPRYIVLPKEGRGIGGTRSLIKRFYPDYRKVKPPRSLRSFVVFSR